MAQKPRPAVTGKRPVTRARRLPASGHGLQDAVARRRRAITGPPALAAAGKSCSQQASWPCPSPLCQGHGILTCQPGEDREQRAQTRITGQEHLPGPVKHPPLAARPAHAGPAIPGAADRAGPGTAPVPGRGAGRGGGRGRGHGAGRRASGRCGAAGRSASGSCRRGSP